MKKRTYTLLFLLIITATATANLLSGGCANQPDLPGSAVESPQINSISWTVDGREVSSPTLKNINQPATIVAAFDNPITLNTAIIKVEGSGIEAVEIYASSNNGENLIYKQDYIEKIAYCTFPALSASNIIIKITKVSGKYSIKDIALKNQKPQNTAFRTTAYIVADTLQQLDDADEGHLANITDIILFGMATFNRNGDIRVDPLLDNSFNIIKKIQTKLNKNYTIYVNFLFEADRHYEGDWNNRMKELAKEVTMAKKDNKEKLANNMISYVKEKGCDGLAFDWEYPMSYKDFNVYGSFIQCLKEKQPDLKVAVALAPWGIKFSRKHIEAIDVIELMCYDLPDSRGHHSSFYTQCEAIEYMKKKKIPLSKVDLGIPFYARPSDMAELWTDYNAESDKLGKYSDKAGGNFGGTDKDRFYNCYQTTYNKTGYSLDHGLGGVMVWHYSCDTPSDTSLSLFNAIASAIKDR